MRVMIRGRPRIYDGVAFAVSSHVRWSTGISMVTMMSRTTRHLQKEVGEKEGLPAVVGQKNGERKNTVEREMQGGLGGGTSQINGAKARNWVWRKSERWMISS